MIEQREKFGGIYLFMDNTVFTDMETDICMEKLGYQAGIDRWIDR